MPLLLPGRRKSWKRSARLRYNRTMAKTKLKHAFRNALIGSLALLLITGFGIYLFGRSMLERSFEGVLGVPVSIQRVRLQFAPSEIGIYGIKVKNLKGFKEPLLAAIPEFYVRMNLRDLWRKQIRIEEIRFHLQEITVERNADKQINLNEWRKLLDARKAQVSAPAPGTQGPGAGETSTPAPKSFNLQIDLVTFSLEKGRFVDNGGARPSMREFVLNIESARLSDVTDPFSVAQQVITLTLQKIAIWVVGAQIDKLSTDLAGRFSKMFQK